MPVEVRQVIGVSIEDLGRQDQINLRIEDQTFLVNRASLQFAEGSLTWIGQINESVEQIVVLRIDDGSLAGHFVTPLGQFSLQFDGRHYVLTKETQAVSTF